jgi:hypothetical protein
MGGLLERPLAGAADGRAVYITSGGARVAPAVAPRARAARSPAL